MVAGNFCFLLLELMLLLLWLTSWFPSRLGSLNWSESGMRHDEELYVFKGGRIIQDGRR